VTEDAHPALIERATFQAAQARRRQRRTRPGQGYRQGRGAKSDYLLTGLIVCGHCGHRWQGYSQWKGRRRKDGVWPKSQYYACGGYVTKGTSVCPRSVVRKDELEAQVFEAIGEHILQYVGTPEGKGKLRQALQDALAHEMADTGELERLRRERDEALRTVNNILDNLTPTNREFADRRIAELKKAIRALDARLAELDAASAAQPDLDDLTDEMLSHMGSFEQIVSEGTVDEKRRFVRAFVQRIEIDPDSDERRIHLMQVPIGASARAPSA